MENGKAIAGVICVFLLCALLVFISCVVGTGIWNDVIAGQFGWTKEITYSDFFELEALVYMLKIFGDVISMKGSEGEKK